ncbi:MAG: Gfo/Idh/MocA family oxidoreductase [Chloroflexota bacterium]|nr:Gfo/Idh/MocA family oxidoreductase [Chloroflexota bacterium]MDE2918415.1 Gfo/Idh/MocA family oxidoreductase [Chloroflexota bacterium]
MTTRHALVGCGSRGIEHLQALAAVPGAEIAACCDLDPDRLAESADRFDVPLRATKIDDLAAAGALDLVHVATMPSVRWPAVKALVDLRPRAILIEKPLATLPSEAARMFAACHEAGIGLFVNHQVPWHPAWPRVRRRLQAGAIGRITHVRASSMGSLFEQGSHLFDLLRYLLDDVASLATDSHSATRPWLLAQATGERARLPPHPGPAHTAGVLAVADDWHIAFECGCRSPRWPGTNAYWLNLGIEITGTRGTLGCSTNRGWWLHTPHESHSEARDYFDDDAPAQVAFLQSVVRSLDNPDAHSCGPVQARVPWNCILAAQRSALLGCPVDPRQGASDQEVLRFRRRLAISSDPCAESA